MSLRNPVHCELRLGAPFAAVAVHFRSLPADLVGLLQILVYIGAVAILIVFAILLTRGTDSPKPAPVATSLGWGLGIAIAAFLTIAAAVTSSVVASHGPAPKSAVTVRAIGDKLMHEYVLPLEVLGLLLTAALIGAVIIAMNERKEVK